MGFSDPDNLCLKPKTSSHSWSKDDHPIPILLLLQKHLLCITDLILVFTYLEFLNDIYKQIFRGDCVAFDVNKCITQSTSRQCQLGWKIFQAFVVSDTEYLDRECLCLCFLSYFFHEKEKATNTISSYKSALQEPMAVSFGIDLKHQKEKLQKSFPSKVPGLEPLSHLVSSKKVRFESYTFQSNLMGDSLVKYIIP